MDAAAQFSKRTAYNNAGDYFVKYTRYIYWDSAQCDQSSDETRNQADFTGSQTTLSSNLIKCASDEVLRVTLEEATIPYIWKRAAGTTGTDEPVVTRDDYVLLEMDGCARNVAAYPSTAVEQLVHSKATLPMGAYKYEEEPVIAKIALPMEEAGKTVTWRNHDGQFGTRYATNSLNKLAFRLLDPDWFKLQDEGKTPAVQFVSPYLSWSCVLRVETLARRHTGLAMMAESLFLQHIQVMQGDILMRKAAGGAPGMGGAGAGDDGKNAQPEAPRTPEEQFREVMAEFSARFPSSLYPGGAGWSVERLESGLRAPNEQPALHAENSKNGAS